MAKHGEGKRRIADQIATVIDKTNYLELLITAIFEKCLLPANERYTFLLTRILHNSVTSFGAKVAVLMVMLEFEKWKDLQKRAAVLHEVLRFRNAFAHTPTNLRRVVTATWADNPPEIISSQMIIESKVGNTLKSITRAEGFSQFSAAYEKALKVLDDITNKVNATYFS